MVTKRKLYILVIHYHYIVTTYFIHKMDKIIVKEIEYPKYMTRELAEMWAEGIPFFSDNDPQNPEWNPTPTIDIGLSEYGYGTVSVKDESVNPTHTIKDRPAWDNTTRYRTYGRLLLANGTAIEGKLVPRLTIITSGNNGKALASMLNKYNCPPIKILADLKCPHLDELSKLHADVYIADLHNKCLTPELIKQITNNRNGVDLTSLVAFNPQKIFYDWHVHESLNTGADDIYVPYGSGMIFANYLTWQEITLENEVDGKRDPRLKVDPMHVKDVNVLGAEPRRRRTSDADKLTKAFNPFVYFDKNDIQGLKSFDVTGNSTGVHSVPEEYIRGAYEILRKFVNTEPSGAAGLALYMYRHDQGLVDPKKKALIINTGKGG